MTLKAKLAALAFLSLAATAHAEVITFKFTGTVIQSLPLALTGAKVTGTFAYDTDSIYIDPPPKPRETSSAMYYGIPQSMRMQVNGHTFESETVKIFISNNSASNVEDTISVIGEGMALDGTRFEQGSFGFELYSGPGNTRALHGSQLPKRIVVKRFDLQKSGFGMVDGSGNGGLVAFEVERIRAVRPAQDDVDEE
jgi:hypothetical protein